MDNIIRERNDFVFVPTKKGLMEAKQKREERWTRLSKENYTKDEQLERMKAEVEIYESMKLVRERAVQCINNVNEIRVMRE